MNGTEEKILVRNFYNLDTIRSHMISLIHLVIDWNDLTSFHDIDVIFNIDPPVTLNSGLYFVSFIPNVNHEEIVYIHLKENDGYYFGGPAFYQNRFDSVPIHLMNTFNRDGNSTNPIWNPITENR